MEGGIASSYVYSLGKEGKIVREYYTSTSHHGL